MSSNLSFSVSTSNSYALALYELAKETSELERIEKEVKDLKQLLVENKDFRNMTCNPTIGKNAQGNAIKKISDFLNFSKTFKNFLGLVASKGRILFLDKIIESFLKIIATSKGQLTAKLVSAKNLSKKEIELIQNDFAKYLEKELDITYEYNPNLIGGFTIQIGSIMFDTSLKNKLNRLQKLMVSS